MHLAKSLLAIPIAACCVCCSVRNSADTTQNENASTLTREQSDTVVERFGNIQLLNQLKTKLGIQKPFAWWAWEAQEKGGTVVGLDENGLLKNVEFITTSEGYLVRPSAEKHELNVPILKSGTLDLEKALPDTEFPFKSFVVNANGCNVHFILLWQALNRSFVSRPAAFLDAISLRLIIERDGTIISNKLEQLLFESLKETLVEDVNKDGKPDFLMIGSNMSTFIRIWTVGEDCATQPLLFNEGDHLLESLGDKGLSIKKNKNTAAYDVHVTHYEPVRKNNRAYYEVTEEIYAWDAKTSVYRIQNTKTWLEPI